MPQSNPDVKTTWVLEMTDPSQLRPRRVESAGLEIRRVEQPCPEFNWFLHQAVGTDFCWGGRQDWSEKEWATYVDRPELETWVAYVTGAPAGYFELDRLDDGSVRMPCFGLLRRFFGQGLGGHLLTFAVERAWQLCPTRVWLSTCSHDHPHALKNYQARGFRIVEELTGSPNPRRRSMLFASG
jgi:ribosomal protein S18 acetylase RimI-like enzyme